MTQKKVRVFRPMADPGRVRGAAPRLPVILGKKRKISHKEEKPAGEGKQNRPSPLPPPPFPLAQGLDPSLMTSNILQTTEIQNIISDMKLLFTDATGQ